LLGQLGAGRKFMNMRLSCTSFRFYRFACTHTDTP
jgi:hypothetical protein